MPDLDFSGILDLRDTLINAAFFALGMGLLILGRILDRRWDRRVESGQDQTKS